jgi:hypothetical protein
VVEKLAPVAVAGEPPVAVQTNVTAPTPPVDDAVHATGLLTVPVRGQTIVTTNCWTITVADAVAVTMFPSVTVTLTDLVPAVLYDVEKLAAVPVAGEPPVAVQANV